MTDDKPYANIRKIGRWTYTVTVRDGLLIFIPKKFTVRGYHRAVHRGKRALKDYIKKKAQNQVERIEL